MEHDAENGLSGLSQATTTRLDGIVGRLRARVGEKAFREAQALASGDLRTLAGALWLAQYVADFRGADSTRLYSCPTCLDTGYQIDESGPGRSQSTACGACDVGLEISAGDWLNRVYPFGRGGKRYHSDQGEAAFSRAFRHFPARKERIAERIEVLRGKGTRTSHGGDTGGTWE